VTDPDEDVRRRQAQVLGDGPRIPPMRAAEFSDEAVELTARMIRAASDANRQASVENVPELVRTLLRHPELFRRLTDFSLQLLGNGALPARDRELVILRIGWLCRAPYEWGEHVEIAKRTGITAQEIERITRGSAADGWSDRDRALLQAAEELFTDAMISDSTWSALEAYLDEKQLIELPILVGQYQTVAYFQNSLRLRLQRGNQGLRAR
jgi:alkylhydroperoxidase family enzyme